MEAEIDCKLQLSRLGVARSSLVRAAAEVFLVRPMGAQPVIALLVITSVQLWLAHAHAADSDAIGRAYTRQATDIARRVVLAELVKHPEQIHRMSMKCTFQLDRQGHPHNVKVVSNTHNRWAEEKARRALAAAKYPPLPKSLIQQSGSDLASFEYKLDLDEPR
jgi:hypothetical protein